ncbi:hypothetical protein CHUAL_001926 [Chamberlinius hualienensis]
MCVIIDTILEHIRRWIQYYKVLRITQYIVKEKESASDDYDYVEDILYDDRHSTDQLLPRCKKPCQQCGELLHISQMKCRSCGFITKRKVLDWNLIRRSSPKSPAYTSKRLFQRIHQLHAAHNRDVIIFIFNHNALRRKGKIYGTPGAASSFLSSQNGKMLRKTWRLYMLKGKLPINSKASKYLKTGIHNRKVASIEG